MTLQEKQEIIAEVKASVMDEHRCVCKPIILRKYPNFFNYILYKCAQCGAETMTDAEHQKNIKTGMKKTVIHTVERVLHMLKDGPE